MRSCRVRDVSSFTSECYFSRVRSFSFHCTSVEPSLAATLIRAYNPHFVCPRVICADAGCARTLKCEQGRKQQWKCCRDDGAFQAGVAAMTPEEAAEAGRNPRHRRALLFSILCQLCSEYVQHAVKQVLPEFQLCKQDVGSSILQSACCVQPRVCGWR